jgi:hypothetical protein
MGGVITAASVVSYPFYKHVCRVGYNHVYTVCTYLYVFFGREITKYSLVVGLSLMLCSDGDLLRQVYVYLGLARTLYIRCIYGIFGREIIKYTVIYGVYKRFWPTLCILFWLTIHVYVCFLEHQTLLSCEPLNLWSVTSDRQPLRPRGLIKLARTVFMHRMWPYIWCLPCQRYCTRTVCVWFWPTLCVKYEQQNVQAVILNEWRPLIQDRHQNAAF